MIAGVGIDTVDVALFKSRLDDRLEHELFVPAEVAYCRSQVRFWENFAARFAAKEAAFKALGQGLSSGLRFRDVEVVKDLSTGAVSLRLSGMARSVMESRGITVLHVSVSHTRKNAVAIVVAESKPV